MNVDTGMQNLEAIQANRTSQKSSGVAGLAAVGMDPFALIFEQMAMAMGQTQEGGLEMGQDTAGDQEGESKDTDNLMMQLAGAMMVQNPQLLAFFQQDDASAAELVSSLNLPADVKQFLLDTRLAAQNSQSNSGAAAAFLEAVADSQSGETVQASEQSNDAQAGTSQSFVEILSNGQDENSADDLQGLQNDFLRSIREAKSLMSNSEKSNQEEVPLDIDQLQSDVMSNRFNPLSSLEGKTARMEFNQSQAPEVDQQIQQGITENLLHGRKEFVIKLRPEGLGEITVKLLEKPGEASVLSLITSSAESAKLINEKLTALQEAMRPLQVQVNMATQQTVEPSQAGSQPDFNSQQFMFDQNQSGANQQQEKRSNQSGDSVFSLTDDGLVEEPEVELEADGLDTYI